MVLKFKSLVTALASRISFFSLKNMFAKVFGRFLFKNCGNSTIKLLVFPVDFFKNSNKNQ